MRIPERLQPLVTAGLMQDVVGQLQSGKEAEVYIIVAQGEYRCAKVYKEANNRTFKQKTNYTEGRKVRGSRQARAMESNSRYGRQERESAWQNTEVEALMLLGSADVVVPKTFGYYEGVLILQMIADAEGQPAPRLNDVVLTPELARTYHAFMIQQVVKMLCAGYIHGDLSEFNILVSAQGLVIIDLPQAVLSTAQNAFSIFSRDVTQLANFFGKHAPELMETQYAHEIWALYENGKLKPDSPVTGKFQFSQRKANVREVMGQIDDARDDEMEKRGLKPRKPSY